jgi:hypothetical protein
MGRKNTSEVLSSTSSTPKNVCGGMKETMYLLKSPANALHLKISIGQYLNFKQKKRL